MYIDKQYDSAKIFIGGYSDLVGCPDPMDSTRIKSYSLYDDFFHNRPETFKVTLRGDSDTEIYLPSSRKMIEATARFLAVEFDFNLSGGNNSAVKTLLDNIFKREEVQKKFIRAKKSGLTRGDAIWHITADPAKPLGERITLNTIPPWSYFPIEDADTQKIIGVHLVDLVHDPRDKENDRSKKVVRRLTYRKRAGVITSAAKLFEKACWDDRWLKPDQLKPVSVLWNESALPPEITALPLYHITNNEPDGSTWGMSQVSGVEYIINALNQSITYEDLTLILQGLGVYVTTAAPPNDAQGKPTTYKLRPGNVVEIAQGDTFERVTGISSVAPYQEHLNFLDRYMGEGLGIPDMATGNIDVAVAQSGIALALKMGPIIAENQDKQLAIAGKWDQLGYDLIHGWFPAFEQLESSETTFETVFGDPMPINREATVNEVVQLTTANLITTDEARKKLEKLGYEYNSSLSQQLLEEASQKATAALGDQFSQEFGASSPDLATALGNGQQ